MSFDHLKSLFLSGILFITLFGVGIFLSQHKLLWLDEIFNQQVCVDSESYAEILMAKTPTWNKNPLSYIIQKAVSDVFSYKLPFNATGMIYSTRDIRSQVILRIPSNFFMSLALALIFYFFIRFYSIGAALYALGVALVTPMVWLYWVEARPYAQWFLLTTAQLLMLIFVIAFSKSKKVKTFSVIHILLALTTPTSIIQISIGAMIVSWKKKYNLKEILIVWTLPMIIALFYVFNDHMARLKTYVFGIYFFDNMMHERLFVDVFYAFVVWGFPKKHKIFFRNAFFLPIFCLFVASGIFILCVDAFTVNSEAGMMSRYLIYLAPVDILMFSLVSIDFWRWSRQNVYACLNVSIILGGMVIARGLMTYREVLSTALYLHSPN